MNIITERPEEMTQEEYKMYRKAQDKSLKHYKKGKVVWLSKLYPTYEVLAELGKNGWTGDNSLGRLLNKGETFVGKVKDLK
jgi:hypothetical protein